MKGISGLDTGPRTNRSCTENLHESSFFKGNFSGQVRDSTIDHRLRPYHFDAGENNDATFGIQYTAGGI